MQDNKGQTDASLKIRRARVDCVFLYEVKENELEILDKGGDAGIYLNFAIALLSSAIAVIVSLFTTTFKYTIMETVFICFAIIASIIGIILLILWFRQKNSVKETIKSIKNRMEQE